jgi:hypothetical protein
MEIRVMSEGVTSSKAYMGTDKSACVPARSKKKKKKERRKQTNSCGRLRKHSKIGGPAEFGRDEEGKVVRRDENVRLLCARV